MAITHGQQQRLHQAYGGQADDGAAVADAGSDEPEAAGSAAAVVARAFEHGQPRDPRMTVTHGDTAGRPSTNPASDRSGTYRTISSHDPATRRLPDAASMSGGLQHQ